MIAAKKSTCCRFRIVPRAVILTAQPIVEACFLELVALIFVMLVVLALIVGGKGSSRRNPRSRKPASRRDSVVRAFDATSAKTTPDARALEGSAYVVDGDTVVIKKTQIRLFGVDAPEMNHPYGKKAKWALVGLCKGQTVRAEITEQDAHGRTVARCYLSDGRDLSAEMVKLGLAIDWPKFSGGKYRSLEVPDARKKMWLADARQKGRMHVWEKYEAKHAARSAEK